VSNHARTSLLNERSLEKMTQAEHSHQKREREQQNQKEQNEVGQ
jgi:hypothetical protein